MSDSADFGAMMGPVALEVMPEFRTLNKGLSNSKEQRWGKKGSFSVDLVKGVWVDHEDGTGGGVLELLKTYKQFEKPEAIDWLIERGYIRPSENQKPFEDPRGKFAGFMDTWPDKIFQYFDDKGKLAYEVLKFPKTAPRRYMQRRPHPDGGWIWALTKDNFGKTRSGDWFKAKEGKSYEDTDTFEDTRWWLYHRDEVVKAVAEGKPIILAEGEKDVDTLREWGFVATTNQGGAKNWRPELNEDLVGADIIICPDNDPAGAARISIRAAELRGIAKRVRVIDLAQHWPEIEQGNDVTDWKEKAGGTAEKFGVIAKRAPDWKPQPPKSRFGAFTLDNIDKENAQVDYIVDGWVTRHGRSVFGGPSMSGKSFFTIHMAMCIARGQDFFEYRVERGGVIYQAGEGGHGIKKRFLAYKTHFNVQEDEDIPLVVLPSKVDLFAKDGDTQNLIDEIKAWSLVLSEPLSIVFIDTLATATIGADENSGKDMGFVLANIARIEEECKVHVCLVHHMNADGKKLRGHTSIHANVDQVVLIEHDTEKKIRTAKLVKQKDDEDGLRIPFALTSVVVGYNARADKDITSCVVLSISEKEELKREQERQGAYVNPTERRVMDTFFSAIDRGHGKYVASAEDGPAGAIGKVVVTWKDYVAVAVDKAIEEDDKTKAADRVRKEFKRVKDNLLRFKILDMDTHYMWHSGRPIRGFKRTFPNSENPDNYGTNSGQTQEIADSTTQDIDPELLF